MVYQPGDEAGCAIEAARSRLPTIAEAMTSQGSHLILEGPHLRHRIFIGSAVCRHGGNFVLPDDGKTDQRLAALTALIAAPASPALATAHRLLKPSAYQSHRLKLLLAVLDRLDRPGDLALTTRELACGLLYPGLQAGKAIDWKSSPRRRQAQRLVSQARYMRDGGFKGLLGYPDARARSHDK